MKLLLATENPGKKRELVSLLSEQGIECLLPSEVITESITFPEESGNTFAENALIKADFLYQKTQLATLADDSGISVKALDNFPGVRSARWIQGDSAARYEGLLKKMEGIKNREAFFTCVLCLLFPQSAEPHYFEGVYQGTIAEEARGDTGFDYDYVFVPHGQNKTLAELGETYKNLHSHRALALQKLSKFLTQNMVN